MKINVKLLCILITLIIFFIFYNVKSISNLNNYKFFLRISELYDIESKRNWEEIINDKQLILDYINKENKQDEYKDYINKIKNNKLFRIKRKYVNKLNDSIEQKNIYKTKRYLNLILNIFEKEHIEVKKHFNIPH